jgi:pyridoxamine---pyruvate transaminase
MAMTTRQGKRASAYADGAVFTYTGGPAAVYERTQRGLARPVLFEYDPTYLERFRSVEERVARVFETEGDVVVMMGEAILGLEAAARGLTRPGMKCLNLVSGIFGKWFGDWLRELGAEVIEIEVPWSGAIDPADVERTLAEHPNTGLVAVVHSETPSGTLNPLAEIGPIVRRSGALLITDAVSAFAGTPIRQDAWGLDITVGGPQKCLGGPPGLTFVAVSERAWQALRDNPAAPRGSYLSLLDWKERWIDAGRHTFPHTTSVADVNGVDAALDELFEVGLEETYARHRRAADACRAGVRAMGLRLWAEDERVASHCVTAVTTPEGVSNAEVVAHIRERYGVMISDGEHGPMTEAVFRLGHMGPASRSLHPVVALAALGRGLRDHGVDVAIGAGIEAALDVIGQEG